jgi:predicted nucleic acid-binding protein
LTLYVESNFVLEIALGQEEAASAEKLLAAAEADAIQIGIPSFALSEPFSRVTRGIRDRGKLKDQLNSLVRQLSRSSPHSVEIEALPNVPDLIARIDQREVDRLVSTIQRLLTTAKIIELDVGAFQTAIAFQERYGFGMEDAVILAVVLADLRFSSIQSRHLFANRNKSDFSDPEIVMALKQLGCDITWSFEDAARRLSIH